MIKSLGTTDFSRVRLGINPGQRSGMERSLCWTPFRKAQMQDLDELLDYASRAVESIIAEGVEKSMTKFNRRARGLTQEE